MPEIKSIPLASIFVPDRLRKVEDEQAAALAISIRVQGLINPITVRSTPAKNHGGTPFTLITGAHRFRAFEILGAVEIEAIVVKADTEDALLLEMSENLFRNDLSHMDRAIFIDTLRDHWEKRYGPILPGRPKAGNYANLAQLGKSEFSQYVASRIGISPRAVKRYCQVAKSLHPDVRAAVRGTPDADNLTLLVNTAKMPPSEQAVTAKLAKEQRVDFSKMLKAVAPAKKPKRVSTPFDLVASNWKKLNADDRARFFATVVKPEELPSHE